MKILVDVLPYYNDECIFDTRCPYRHNVDVCPRYWDKYKVCDERNPHECHFLKELEGSKDDYN